MVQRVQAWSSAIFYDYPIQAFRSGRKHGPVGFVAILASKVRYIYIK